MQSNILRIISLLTVVVTLSFFFTKEKVELPNGISANLPSSIHPAPSPEIEIQAKAGCVFDMNKNKFIFEHNTNVQLPLASLTKLMTAIVAKEKLLESTVIQIPAEAIAQEGDSGFVVEEKWKLSDLLKVMLISSSNDAAFAIGSAFQKANSTENKNGEFIKLMNEKAKELNLHQTYFLNTSGLDLSKTVAGAYGSCRDITSLINYFLLVYPDLANITTSESINIKNLEFKNTDQLLNKLPSFFASKTGFSDLAGGNLSVIIDKGLNNPIIITVLGSTQEGRFEDVEKLYKKFLQ